MALDSIGLIDACDAGSGVHRTQRTQEALVEFDPGLLHTVGFLQLRDDRVCIEVAGQIIHIQS